MLKPTERKSPTVDPEKERRKQDREKIKKMREEFLRRDNEEYFKNFDNRPREARMKGGV